MKNCSRITPDTFLMKNILFDCERMKYRETGLYHYCLNLGKSLSKLADGNREQLSFFYPGKEQHQPAPFQTTIRQHSLHKFLLPSLRRFDVLHCTYQNSDYLPVRNKRIRVVLSIHDLNFMYDEKKTEAKKRKYLEHLQKNIDRSDAIICISAFSRNDVARYCNTGNKPVHTILNGTNQLPEPSLDAGSYKPHKRFMFSIGVIARKKNFHTLLPLLRDNDMELLIAGRPDDREYLYFLLDRAEELGVSDKFKILGMISEHEKSWYFRHCYAFASPSVAEGFCLPVAEAMSAGKPLFLSNRTALPEIGGKVAFYFSDFNSSNMQHVFLDGMRTYDNTNMKEQLKERAASFSWDKAAAQYLEVYRSLYL